MLDWIYSKLNIPYQELVGPFLIVLLFLLLSKLYGKYLSKLFLRLTDKPERDLAHKIVKSTTKPFSMFIFAIGFYFGVKSFPFDTSQYEFIEHLYSSMFILTVMTSIYNFIKDYSSNNDVISEKLHLNKMFTSYFSRVLRFSIIGITTFMISNTWGYDLNGLVTGLGITGMAFAFAARETFGNIFSGVVIMIEQPFNIGDWIAVGDIEGIVEDINIRSTKVRTFSQSLMIVPNSKLTNESLVNWSKMGERKVNFTLDLHLETDEGNFHNAVERIKYSLSIHPDLNREKSLVYFDKITESTLQVNIEFFTSKISKKEFLSIKEEINFTILKILKEENVKIANNNSS